MKPIIKGALIALAVAERVVRPAPAQAAVRFHITLGNGGAAFGYSDGYWIVDQPFSTLRNREYAE